MSNMLSPYTRGDVNIFSPECRLRSFLLRVRERTELSNMVGKNFAHVHANLPSLSLAGDVIGPVISGVRCGHCFARR